MIRLGKLTDYGLVLMTHIAQNHDRLLRTARDLAVESRLPLPTVSKLLKELLQGQLLVLYRGECNEHEPKHDPRLGGTRIQVGLRHFYRGRKSPKGTQRGHYSPDLGQEK